MRSNSGPIMAALGTYGEDFGCNGRDGTGPKSYVPWVRFFSKSKSPSAQTGWYCVYLFRPDGSAVALSISHGSTTWDGNIVTPRSEEEAAKLLGWAADVIG